MGAYCHTRVSCACALRAHPPPTPARDSRLASIAAFAYNLCLWAWGPPTLKKKIKLKIQFKLLFAFGSLQLDLSFKLFRDTTKLGAVARPKSIKRSLSNYGV